MWTNGLLSHTTHTHGDFISTRTARWERDIGWAWLVGLLVKRWAQECSLLPAAATWTRTTSILHLSSAPSVWPKMETVKLPVQVVLLDIEGTVCPISFVHDVLFPFALDALPALISTQWDTPVFAPYRSAFPAEYNDLPSAFEGHVRDLVARDVKAPYLKSLQGYLWREGYQSGQLLAPLFADVEPAMEAWHAAGLRIAVYSSGSVAAQQLFFAHTTSPSRPNLAPLISAWFDTVNAGPKLEAASYAKIASHLGMPPAHCLFLSDHVGEVAVARLSGMQSVAVTRPGNTPVPSDQAVITDFSGLHDLR